MTSLKFVTRNQVPQLQKTCISRIVKINDSNDSLSLQNDLNALSKWERDWQMNFNVGKCHTMCISTGRHVELEHSYTLNSHTLERVHHHSYLVVLLSENLKWASHVAHVTSSANQTLGVIRRNFRTASVECISQLYCSLVRPKLEYANSAWYPYLQKDKHRLDMVRHSAARVCYNNYLREPGVVTNMLNELEWPSLRGGGLSLGCLCFIELFTELWTLRESPI